MSILTNWGSLQDERKLPFTNEWKNTLLGNVERLFVIFADFIMMRRQLLNF